MYENLIYIKTRIPVSIYGLQTFWKEALGEHFTEYRTVEGLNAEFLFVADEETSCLFRQTSKDGYQVQLRSSDSRIANGLYGYVAEVIEEQTQDTVLVFKS